MSGHRRLLEPLEDRRVLSVTLAATVDAAEPDAAVVRGSPDPAPAPTAGLLSAPLSRAAATAGSALAAEDFKADPLRAGNAGLLNAGLRRPPAGPPLATARPALAPPTNHANLLVIQHSRAAVDKAIESFLTTDDTDGHGWNLELGTRLADDQLETGRFKMKGFRRI